MGRPWGLIGADDYSDPVLTLFSITETGATYLCGYGVLLAARRAVLDGIAIVARRQPGAVQALERW
jgi:hypothetical protein